MEDGKVLLEGPRDKNSPIYQAMRKVYEQCGGTSGEDMTRINRSTFQTVQIPCDRPRVVGASHNGKNLSLNGPVYGGKISP